jgi:serpin B
VELTKAANTNGNELLNANGLWVQHGFPVLSTFKQLIEQTYGAAPRQLDFLGATEYAREEINTWTGQHTKGKIAELFGPGSLDRNTRLVLTSAIYFHGKWQSIFRARDTRPGPFKLDSGGTVDTSFMHQTGQFGYAETGSTQILEMRYAGGGLACDILLPGKDSGLVDLDRTINAGSLAAWLTGLHEQTVEVEMPKFRQESEFSLRETLARMGMRDAFTVAADFSGIDDRRDLALSDVLHKAFVDVTEEGTEAAAATGTAVHMIAMIKPPEHKVFRADHPFVFVIRDKQTGVILFAGQMVNPGSRV